MENSLNFTEAENKIRKKWLFLSTKLPAFIFGCLLIVAIALIFIRADFMRALPLVGGTILFSGAFYLNYYCAYKNPGTILLLLQMIGIPLNLLVNFFKSENLILMQSSIWSFLPLVIFDFFQIIVFYYAYKLRKVNKKMQERKLMITPTYITAVSVFSTATNLEELDEQFSKLRPSHSGEAIEALAKAYDDHKKVLKLALNP